MQTFFGVLFLLVFIVGGLARATDFRGNATNFARRSLERARPAFEAPLRNETEEQMAARFKFVVRMQRVIGAIFVIAGAALMIAMFTAPRA